MPLSEELLTSLAQKRSVMTAFLAALTGTNTDLTLDEFRVGYTKSLQAFPVIEGAHFESVDMHGVPGLRVSPENTETERVLLYIHGGGYIVGHPDGYRSFASALSMATNSVVYVPDYRLAPEYHFPAPLDDVFTAYRYLLETNIKAKNLAIAGDGAGGGMTISTMIRVREAGLSLPAGAAVFSPWVNLEHTGESMKTCQKSDLVHADTPECWDIMARSVLGDIPTNNAEASPVFADVNSLPPVFIQVTGSEQLFSDAVRLAHLLGSSGVSVTLDTWADMFFGWQMYHTSLAEASDALGRATNFINKVFEKSSP